MNINSLETLLEQLNSGDDAAAEQVFLTYEPYLRKVVRRLLPANLRAKFDSIDVVQSVYGDVLTAFRTGGMQFSAPAQLRAFLIRATRNRFIDRVRHYRSCVDHEVPVGEVEYPASQPTPSETAQAKELWERLTTLCPPEHLQLLNLRRLGASAGEIAERLHLHEGSVRRILRELALRLASESVSASR